MEAAAALPLPDDVLADVLRLLPPHGLAVSRSVCRAWRAVVDGRALLRPKLLPRAVRGVFLNYVDHSHPHLLARPSPPPALFPRAGDDGTLRFIPEGYRRWWSVLDHSNGLLLCGMDMGHRLCVCNPATRRWTLLPRCAVAESRGGGSYIAFDPAASSHFEVVLIPSVPAKPKKLPDYSELQELRARRAQQEKDAPFCLDWFFSSPDGAPIVSDEAETEEEEFPQLYFSSRTGRWQGPHDDDPCRLMEWPPTPWNLHVFSSRTGQWEERCLVREGEAMGVVEDARSDPLEKPTWYGSRHRYTVYSKGVLYVHCQGPFLMRLSLSDDKYQVIKTPPANINQETKPYLGILGNRVCFGITDKECKLSVWILNEASSSGQMEWVLKYEVDLMHIAQYVGCYCTKMNGAWILTQEERSGKATKAVPSENSDEWDSDNDGVFEVSNIDDVEYYMTELSILGFHPYKEVVFLVENFKVVAYHLNSSKVQYLGKARPKCYYGTPCHGVYESFVYTPCLIGSEGLTESI